MNCGRWIILKVFFLFFWRFFCFFLVNGFVIKILFCLFDNMVMYVGWINDFKYFVFLLWYFFGCLFFEIEWYRLFLWYFKRVCIWEKLENIFFEFSINKIGKYFLIVMWFVLSYMFLLEVEYCFLILIFVNLCNFKILFWFYSYFLFFLVYICIYNW